MKGLNIIRLYRTSSKRYMTITSHLQEVIVRCMLGDLHAEKPSNKHNTRLQFKQSTINIQYIRYLFQLFGDYCGSVPTNIS
jgi:LAGLIDADG DNA endonuclease family